MENENKKAEEAKGKGLVTSILGMFFAASALGISANNLVYSRAGQDDLRLQINYMNARDNWASTEEQENKQREFSNYFSNIRADFDNYGFVPFYVFFKDMALDSYRRPEGYR